MGNKIQFVIAIAVLVALATAGCVTSSVITRPHHKGGSNHPHSLEYLGKSEGKQYYLEIDVKMDWGHAYMHCLEANMSLATIESENQADFLNSALGKFPPSFYWTSGRESQEPDMIVWEESRTKLNTTFLKSWSFQTTGLYYCASVFTFENYYFWINVGPCEQENYVLCQI